MGSSAEYTREWKLRNPARMKEYRHRARLAAVGWSAEEYESAMRAQAGLCAICEQPERVRRRNGVLYDLAADHDHKTGKSRGLLCRRCNLGIGHLQDDPALVAAALAYLNRYEMEDA